MRKILISVAVLFVVLDVSGIIFVVCGLSTSADSAVAQLATICGVI